MLLRACNFTGVDGMHCLVVRSGFLNISATQTVCRFLLLVFYGGIERKKRKITLLGVITGASRPRGISKSTVA